MSQIINTSSTWENPYSIKNKKYFKLIIEDTAIENHVHARSQEQWDYNIEQATQEAYDYLHDDIEDIENNQLYQQVIDDLVHYCLVNNNSMINTDWDNDKHYKEHIMFIKEFQEKYSYNQSFKINPHLKPFGNKLLLDIQDYILTIKYIEELKYWRLHQFVIKHTNPILEYLNDKLKLAMNGR